jgi:hypothetical protein
MFGSHYHPPEQQTLGYRQYWDRRWIDIDAVPISLTWQEWKHLAEFDQAVERRIQWQKKHHKQLSPPTLKG